MQDAHSAFESDRALPDAKSESPLPGWPSTKAAAAATEAAAAPTEVARTNRDRSDRPNPSDAHVGGTDVDS